MSYRTLIIENDSERLKRWRAALEKKLGCEVIEDPKGDAHLWREKGCDLVLINIATPQLNGLKTLRELRKAQPRTQVVVIVEGQTPTLADAVRCQVWNSLDGNASDNEVVQVVRDALLNRNMFLLAVENLVLNTPDPKALFVAIDGEPISALDLFEAVKLEKPIGVAYREKMESILFEIIEYPEMNRSFREGTLLE